MKPKRLALILVGSYFAVLIALVAIFGFKGKQNSSFDPQSEFELHNWIHLGVFSINKAVMYVIIAGLLTVGTMIYIANRMQARPNRIQTLIELIYTFSRDNITGENMVDKMARRWFPVILTLFLFIWFSNLIGYIPLPTSHEHFDLFGLQIPSFALYAATANISVPLVLSTIVWLSFNIEGIRAKGFFGYFKGLIPAGIHGPAAIPMFFLELISMTMRLVSLSVRLFANLLAGHLIILFMAGGLAVILGITALGWITLPIGIALFTFEVGLVATLQAFIFATLSAIFLGGAVAEEH